VRYLHLHKGGDLPVTGMMPLTPEEQAFVEQNMKLLSQFMRRYDLGPEYYGRLGLHFTQVAVRYLREKELRRFSFSTVVWMRLRTELSHIMREELRAPQVISLEEQYYPEGREDEYESLLWHMISQLLTPRQQQVLRLRLDGKTNVEIANECGISRKAVEHLFARIRARVEKLIDDTS